MQNAAAQHTAKNYANGRRVAANFVAANAHIAEKRDGTRDIPKYPVITDRTGCVVCAARNWRDVHAAHLALGLV